MIQRLTLQLGQNCSEQRHGFTEGEQLGATRGSAIFPGLDLDKIKAVRMEN